MEPTKGLSDNEVPAKIISVTITMIFKDIFEEYVSVSIIYSYENNCERGKIAKEIIVS